MALKGHHKMSEDERLQLLELKSEQEALEIFLAGGGASVTHDDLDRFRQLQIESNEFKRSLLLNAGEIDEGMFDFTYYFDSVAGFIWFEEDEE